MILTTPEELRMYLPTHVIESLEPLNGFIDSSEYDFLIEKIGAPLYGSMSDKYNQIVDKTVLTIGTDENNPWHTLIQLCQRPVAFDMLYRAADVSAISVSESGLNVLDSGGYDAADGKVIERYKQRLNIEAHRAIDRLLSTLEEWAVEIHEKLDVVTPEVQKVLDAKKEIIGWWKQSRYFYLAEGLFVNTAKSFNELVNIYESREKFIQLLPDLRYCQEFVLRPEMGDALTDDLLDKMRAGNGNAEEKQAIQLARYALVLHTEARSKLFNRPEAKDEALGALRRLVEYLTKNQSKLDAKAVSSSPFYVKPAPPVTDTPSGADKASSSRWKNNRKGQKLFVTRAIE